MDMVGNLYLYVIIILKCGGLCFEKGNDAASFQTRVTDIKPASGKKWHVQIVIIVCRNRTGLGCIATSPEIYYCISRKRNAKTFSKDQAFDVLDRKRRTNH
jgi:hypothetical protein